MFKKGDKVFVYGYGEGLVIDVLDSAIVVSFGFYVVRVDPVGCCIVRL